MRVLYTHISIICYFLLSTSCPTSSLPPLFLSSFLTFLISLSLFFLPLFFLKVRLSLLSIHCRRDRSFCLLLKRNVAEKLFDPYGFSLCVCVRDKEARCNTFCKSFVCVHILCILTSVRVCVNIFKLERG